MSTCYSVTTGDAFNCDASTGLTAGASLSTSAVGSDWSAQFSNLFGSLTNGISTIFQTLNQPSIPVGGTGYPTQTPINTLPTAGGIFSGSFIWIVLAGVLALLLLRKR